MSNIKGEIRPMLGKNIYTLKIKGIKNQHWQLYKKGIAIVDLGSDGGVTFNQSSLNQEYVIKVTYTENASGKNHTESLAVKPIAGKPSIEAIKWQDEYYEDLDEKLVAYGDKVRLFIHVINIPADDTLNVTVWEDEGLDGHADNSRKMGTYSCKVDKYGKAELFFNNLRVFQSLLNNKDYINELMHEFYVQVKYRNKINDIEDGVQLLVSNNMQRLVKPPTHNKFVVVAIPDKQKPPKQQKGVKVTLNIFFDGTKNNAKNTEARLAYEKETKQGVKKDNLSLDAKAFKENVAEESSYNNFYSNVAIMHKLNIEDLPNKVIKIYIEGEGTQDHREDDTQGYAFGSGYSSGIPVKVTKAFNEIRASINLLKNKKIIGKEEIINEMDINVFGFSRGAAAARSFVAQKFKLQTEYNIETPKFNVKFVGLYDTVSSYSKGASASPDFDNDVKELKLKVEGVQKIVHLTAADEYREYFSLTNVKSSIEAGVAFELELPGVHSDIGGGYAEMENEIRHFDDEENFHNMMEIVLKEGWYTRNQIKTITETKLGERPNATRLGIPNSYQYIPLAIMIHLAEKYGLKFNKKYLDTDKQIYNVPEDLQFVKKGLLAYALQNDGAKSKAASMKQEYLYPIRNKYLHRSTCDAMGKTGRYKDGQPYRKIIDA
jgi:hypothetical protein